jgi:integrase
LAIRKIRDRFAVEFEIRGNRVFRRLPAGATKAQAQALEARLRHELIDQAVLGKTAIVPLVKAIEAWRDEVVTGRKDEDETCSKAGLVIGAVAGLPLTKAGVVEAAAKVRSMDRVRGEGEFSAATINRRLSVIKGVAKWAWKVKHWTPENLSPYVILIDKKQERVRTRVIDQKQVIKLLQNAPNFEAQAFIAFGVYALMRQGEVMKCRPEHLGRGIHLRDRKTGAPIVLPVVRQLKPYLKAIPMKHHKRTLYGWFEEARDAAGIEDLIYHDLRRSGATILLNEGVALELVARALGDSLEVARRHYAHVLDKTLERAFRKGFKPIGMPIRKGGPGGI